MSSPELPILEVVFTESQAFQYQRRWLLRHSSAKGCAGPPAKKHRFFLSLSRLCLPKETSLEQPLTGLAAEQ